MSGWRADADDRRDSFEIAALYHMVRAEGLKRGSMELREIPGFRV